MSISALVEIAKHGISEGYENIDVLAGFITEWLNTNANALREKLFTEMGGNINSAISVIRNVAEDAIIQEQEFIRERRERRLTRKSRDRPWDEVKSEKRGGKSKKRVKRKNRKTKRK